MVSGPVHIAQFVNDRNAALLSMDRPTIEAFLQQYGIAIHPVEETFWASVHKARANIPTLSSEERKVSVQWLADHGYSPEIVLGGPPMTPSSPSKSHLGALMDAIEYHDANYEQRYGLVLHAVCIAHQLGYPAGFRIDPQEPEWPVAYIELPTGQVSWHMPQHPVAFDGHDTPEKYRRARAFSDANS